MRDLLEWRKEQREIDFLCPSRGVLPISVLTHKSKQENKRKIIQTEKENQNQNQKKKKN